MQFNFSKVAELKRATLIEDWTPLQVFFDWFQHSSRTAFFVDHLPVVAYVRCLNKKEWKKWNSVFTVLSLTFFIVALQGSVAEIKTN